MQYLDLLKHHCTFTFFWLNMSRNLKNQSKHPIFTTSSKIEVRMAMQLHTLFTSQKFIPALVNPRYRAKLKCAWLGWTNNDRVGPSHFKLATKFPAFPWKKNMNLQRESFSICSSVFLATTLRPDLYGFILDQTNGNMPCIASELATR